MGFPHTQCNNSYNRCADTNAPENRSLLLPTPRREKARHIRQVGPGFQSPLAHLGEFGRDDLLKRTPSPCAPLLHKEQYNASKRTPESQQNCHPARLWIFIEQP
ncbi:hypothetical protein GCM10010368_66590 [Streptomyces roseiscleroticus]|uniref:Uncharacterized protein n=1 Tax=Streptomyces roseiscleroticus TaxID=1972 RepID=A0ABN3F489_9ACTN